VASRLVFLTEQNNERVFMATSAEVKRITEDLIQLHRDKEESIQTTRRITVAIQEKRRELNRSTRSVIDVSDLKQVDLFEPPVESELFENVDEMG
jgi:hypothetical protein